VTNYRIGPHQTYVAYRIRHYTLATWTSWVGSGVTYSIIAFKNWH